ncbi:MAG: tetratricopeptide repeat protein [Labilithrix sp.]|nr:tetratricopeptide repeat protein [Labilithrix sp.]
MVTVRQWLDDYFLGDDPGFGLALVPFCFLSMLLFTRHPSTNFIFDEQEALLANPYVRSIAEAQPKFRWIDAFYRDFWGLGPERSIGSYRPIPDLVWRALWGLGAREQTPFLHHWVNVLLHGMNGALVCVVAFQLTKRRSTAWLAGACFTASGVLTEAVSGVVGISDVLGATGVLLALAALSLRLPWMALGVFFASLFGLYSKESALCVVPLVPFAALLAAQIHHPEKPRRWLRAAVAFVAAAGAFVLYVEARRRMFPAPLPAEVSVDANAEKPFAARTFAAILRWYAQPTLPRDPLNNPLVNAAGPERIAGALRVYFRGLEQIVFPHPLSGDYSAPQEPVPPRLVFPESVLGALAMLLPLPGAAWLGISAWRRAKRAKAESETPKSEIDARPIVGLGLVWIMVSYFPVSNIPVLLPTVRAERFWYFPVIGSSLVLAIAFAAALARWPAGTRGRKITTAGILVFFGVQAICARLHANDYTDDLVFWNATRKAVPRSAKAHLNYSVMKGARGDLEARLAANRTALELAPQWPMASIYLGDTLCRLHRAPEAWPHYVRGFQLAPNDVNLVALALQCLWDEKMLAEGSNVRSELDVLKDKHPGTWVEYLGKDILEKGEEHKGVDPKYRPRGYNEGPKD